MENRLFAQKAIKIAMQKNSTTAIKWVNNKSLADE